jgi:hypothetical protein
MVKRLVLVVAIVFAVFTSVASVGTANAATVVSQNITLSCNSVSGAILATADRNPEEVGFEVFIERVTDGKGTILWEDSVSVEIGAQDGFGPTATSITPAANPITYQFISAIPDRQPTKPGVKTGKAALVPHHGEEVVFSTSYNCANFGVVCNTEGGFQGRLTAWAKLYWAADENKAVVPETFIPPNKVVTIIDNATPGWVKIVWSCQTYYIKAGLNGKNWDLVSKPHLPTR